MLVFDRSGSMSMDDGTGRQKIEAARDAVSLFVQLIKAGTGNQLALVSFSTNPTLDHGIANVTGGAKTVLIDYTFSFSGERWGHYHPEA